MAPWQQKYFLNVRKQAQYVYQSAVPINISWKFINLCNQPASQVIVHNYIYDSVQCVVHSKVVKGKCSWGLL